MRTAMLSVSLPVSSDLDIISVSPALISVPTSKFPTSFLVTRNSEPWVWIPERSMVVTGISGVQTPRPRTGYIESINKTNYWPSDN